MGGVSRRAFLVWSAAFFAAPLAAEAQQTHRIAFLCAIMCSSTPSGPSSAWDQAFMKGLEQSGFRNDRNLDFDMRAAGDTGYDGLPDAARRLVGRKPDVIVAFGNAATRAARRATATIPIVMVLVTDPVEDGLISSLASPGGNITGLALPYEQLLAKHVQLVKEFKPTVTHIAVISTSPGPDLPATRLRRITSVTRGLGVQLYPVEIRDARNLERTFADLPVARPDALVLPEASATSRMLRTDISTFALKHRIPTIASDRLLLRSGGLISYGPDLLDVYERSAVYTAKVLRGVKPNDLPVEEPTRFELIISNVTAKALGLTIPPSLLLRADQVID